MLLKAAGVKTVVASDLSQGRRALAARCGADKVVDPTQESPYSAVKQQQKHFTDAPALFGEAFKALKALQTIPGVPWRHIVRLASDAGLTPSGPVVFECVGVPGMIDSIIRDSPLRSLVVVVGVCMEADTIRMRTTPKGLKPFVMTNLKTQAGLKEVIAFIETKGMLV